MCEFHGSNCNGLGDSWWTDKCTYFSSIDSGFRTRLLVLEQHALYTSGSITIAALEQDWWLLSKTIGLQPLQ